MESEKKITHTRAREHSPTPTLTNAPTVVLVNMSYYRDITSTRALFFSPLPCFSLSLSLSLKRNTHIITYTDIVHLLSLVLFLNSVYISFILDMLHVHVYGAPPFPLLSLSLSLSSSFFLPPLLFCLVYLFLMMIFLFPVIF